MSVTRRQVIVLAAATLVGAGGAVFAPRAQAAPSPACESGMCTVTFTSGASTFTVPEKITRIDIMAIGPRGDDARGLGAKVTSTVGVEAGQILDISIAHGPAVERANVGGRTVAASGGAETVVSRESVRLVVASRDSSSSRGDAVTTTAELPAVVITYIDPTTIPDGPTCTGWSCLFDS